MKIISAIPLVFALALLSLGSPACYPDEDRPGEQELRGLRLPLSDMGIRVSEKSLVNWIDWLGDDGFLGTAFDMSQEFNDFAMGVHLYSGITGAEIGFQGQSVTYTEVGQEEFLMVDMTISECQDCWFEVVIFWRDAAEPNVINVFSGSGENNPFTIVPDAPDNPTIWEIDAWQHDTGRVECIAGSQAVPIEASLSILDFAENVRIYSRNVQLDQDPLAQFSRVPIDRELVVELDALGDGRYFTPIESVTLVNDGQVAVVALP